MSSVEFAAWQLCFWAGLQKDSRPRKHVRRGDERLPNKGRERQNTKASTFANICYVTSASLSRDLYVHAKPTIDLDKDVHIY